MKNIIFISLLIGLLSAAHIQAQSYLYNKNASGLAVSYTRIAGINFAAVDYTYRGILSVGGTLALDNGREGYGINGILNLCKYLGSRSVFSLPIFIGSQSVNGNNAISFGVGAYSKMFSSETFSTAVGVSYSRTKVQNYFSDNYTGQFGVEVFLFYKDFKIGPTIAISETLNFGFTAGFAFNHRNDANTENATNDYILFTIAFVIKSTSIIFRIFAAS